MATVDNGSIGPGPSETDTDGSIEDDQQSRIIQVLGDQLVGSVKIMVAGRSGAGKSTFVNNILETGEDVELSLDPTDQVCVKRKYPLNEASVEIIDTPGLRGAMAKQLVAQTKDIDQADLLVYCLPINPGAKFVDEKVMHALQDVYGSNVWKHCILVFTFSNYALDHCAKSTTSSLDDDHIAKYKRYVNHCAERFEQSLKRSLKVKDVTVKTIFQENQNIGSNTIIAIPAGFENEDKVHPGVIEDEAIEQWKDRIFLHMLRKCKDNGKPGLLRLRYGYYQMIKALREYKVVVVGSTGGGTGAAVGAGVGGVVGVAGGPAGVVLGGMLGAAAGIVAGVIFAAATTGVRKLRSDDEDEEAKKKFEKKTNTTSIKEVK